MTNVFNIVCTHSEQTFITIYRPVTWGFGNWEENLANLAALAIAVKIKM